MEDGGLLDRHDVTCPVVYGLDAVARERRSGAEKVLYLFLVLTAKVKTADALRALRHDQGIGSGGRW